jgi:hypothetical protein
VLIEHGLPRVVVGDSMVNNKGDGHCGPSPGAWLPTRRTP